MYLNKDLNYILVLFEDILESAKKKYAYDRASISLKKSMQREYKYLGEQSQIDQITSLLTLIRNEINSLPTDINEDKNQTYQKLIKYHNELTERIEGKEGILETLMKNSSVDEKIEKIRGHVYLIVKTLSILQPKEMLLIEKQTNVTLKLRELSMIKPAELLESFIIEKLDNDTKILRTRNSLEQTIIAILKSHNINIGNKFFHNLDLLNQNELIKKAFQKTISKHYSYISQIVHSEIEATDTNILYGLNVVLEIIDKLLGISSKIKKK